MGSSQASIITTMASIQAWVEEVEQVINSQASFDTFQPAEVEEIVNRFRAVLETNLNCREVSQMVRAISLLFFVTGNLASTRDRLVDLLHGLLASFLFLKQKGLVTRELNEEVLDVVTQCVEGKEVKMMVLEGLAGQMLAVIVNSNLEDWIRRSWLKTFNLLLSGSDYKLKEDIRMEYREDLEQLVDYLYTCGDYDTQSSLVETLLRFTSKTDRPKLAMMWFPNYALVQSLFVRIKDFETDCRNFLNSFNHGLGNNQLVFTLPSLSCHVGEQEIYKPPDQKYRQFWVDFNLGPGSISIYHVKEEGSTDLWDLLTITQDMVTSASTISQAGSTVLTLSLSQSSLPFSQAVFVFFPDPKLSELLLQIFPQTAVTAPPPVPAVKSPQCSPATGKLLLPKSSCPHPPPAVTAVTQLTTADVSSSSQASLPCGQAGRMSSAEVPAQVDTKARQAACNMGQVGGTEHSDKENNNFIVSETPEEAVEKMDEEKCVNNLIDKGSEAILGEECKVRFVPPDDEATITVEDSKICPGEKGRKKYSDEDVKDGARRSEAEQKAGVKTTTEEDKVNVWEEKKSFVNSDKKCKTGRLSFKKKEEKISRFQKAKKKAVVVVESKQTREDAKPLEQTREKDNSRNNSVNKYLASSLVGENQDNLVGIEMEKGVEEGRYNVEKMKKADQLNGEEQPSENVHVGYSKHDLKLLVEDVNDGMVDETPSKDCDFLPPSPAHMITLSGGRRRAKRKLSLTRRKVCDIKDKHTKLSFSSPTTNISNSSLTVPVMDSSSLAAVVQATSPPVAALSDSAPQSSVICPPPHQEVICPPPSQAAAILVHQAEKVCSGVLPSADICPPTSKVNVMSPPTASICLPPSPQAAGICPPSLPPDDSFPPSSCDSLSGLAKLLSKKPKLSFPKKKGRVSISPRLSQVGELSQEDREMEVGRRVFQENTKTNSIKIPRRSFLKKKLLSTKSLLLDEEVSENISDASKDDQLSDEDVYKRKNAKENPAQMKNKVSTNPPAAYYAGQPDPPSLPPLGVTSKSLNTSHRRSLNNASKVWHKKLSKDNDSSLSGGGRGKTFTKSWPRGSSDGDTNSGPGSISILAKKTRKSKPRRKSVSTRLASGKTKRSTSLFSDDEDEEDMTKPVESPLLNPLVSSISNRPAEQSLDKAGIMSKRSYSRSSTIYAETSCHPFMLGQMSSGLAEKQEGLGAGEDPGNREVKDVLIWSMRVLDMVSRKGKTQPQLREKWKEIRRIAEKEEGRKTE